MYKKNDFINRFYIYKSLGIVGILSSSVGIVGIDSTLSLGIVGILSSSAGIVGIDYTLSVGIVGIDSIVVSEVVSTGFG